MENPFYKKMIWKTDQDLLGIINSQQGWVDMARLAAIEEYEKRKGPIPNGLAIKKELERIIREENEAQNYKLRFISKKYVYLFSLFLSPLFVGPFLAYNMWESKSRKGLLLTLLVTGLFIIVGLMIYTQLQYENYALPVMIVYHVIGIVIIVELLWYKYIPNYNGAEDKAIS